jgi:hypothetical protein
VSAGELRAIKGHGSKAHIRIELAVLEDFRKSRKARPRPKVPALRPSDVF